MNNIILKIKGILHRVVGKTWITTPGPKMCQSVPVILVEVDE